MLINKAGRGVLNVACACRIMFDCDQHLNYLPIYVKTIGDGWLMVEPAASGYLSSHQFIIFMICLKVLLRVFEYVLVPGCTGPLEVIGLSPLISKSLKMSVSFSRCYVVKLVTNPDRQQRTMNIQPKMTRTNRNELRNKNFVD